MRFQGSVGAVLWLAISCGVFGQSLQPAKTPSRDSLAQAPQPTLGTNLLDLDDGLAILGAALESRHKAERRSDCSHLVHAIYEKAGYLYEYQTSRDLFAGHAPDFRRVTQPQPGDLIVWPGHAGVVVNPAQRTFYSSLRSGFGVQPYDSAYWKGRGRPRFFRYVKGTTQPPVQTAANRTATLQPAGFHPGGEDSRTASVVEGKAHDLSRPNPDATAASTAVAITINSALPSREQVRAALDPQFRAAGQALQSHNILAVYPALVAFDRLDIQKVQLTGNLGWVQLTIHGAVLVAGADKRPRKKLEVQRWSLHRVNDDSWELVLPTDTTYVPRETAVHLLAQQLAALTDDASDSQAQSNQKVQLAHWLNVLLNTQ
jgi:hypothetical protein